MNGHPGLDRIADLVLGLVSEADKEARETRDHLEACHECAARGRRIEGERSLMTEALSVRPPAALASRILGAIETRPARGRAWMARIPLAAAAVLFGAIIATLLFRPHPGATTEYVLEDGSRVTLAPQAEALLPGGGILDLRRGRASFVMPGQSRPLKVVTPIGTVTARGAEFSVELRNRAESKGEARMETLLALVVAVIAGNVRVDVAGTATALTAGETRVFTTAPAIQDKDDGEKGQKGKNEKGKKNDNDDGDKEDGKKKEKKGEKGEKDDEGKEKGKKKDKKEKEDD
jgi:ferric-dicitrate binding protein FerR (iron transport regulator)